eukprot:5581593-Pyramimonas_sp.AAC.1
MPAELDPARGGGLGARSPDRAIPLRALRKRWQVKLYTDSAELTVKPLLSHLVTGEFNSPTNSLRAPYVCA